MFPSGRLQGSGVSMPPYSLPFYPAQPSQSWQPYPYAPYGGSGYAVPGAIPTGQPVWTPAALPKRRNYALIGLVAMLLIALVAGAGAAVLVVANNSPRSAPPVTKVAPTATSIYIPLLHDPPYVQSTPAPWSDMTRRP